MKIDVDMGKGNDRVKWKGKVEGKSTLAGRRKPNVCVAGVGDQPFI